MSNTNEQIEARLAAYIDGECTPAERVEIEKYLAGNPVHKQLIEDLIGIKTKITQLPGEKAPAEVLDYLQTNLERHALLEDVESSAASMHINRWPQFAAVAAVLLLTVGLGSLIYLVLPRDEFNRNQIVLAPPAVQKLPGNPSLSEAALEDNKSVENKDKVINEATPTVVMKAEPTREVVMDATTAPAPATNALASATNLTLNNGSAIVVQTDDAMLTQNLVAGYLGQNQYQFSPVTLNGIALSAGGGNGGSNNLASLNTNAGMPGQNATDVTERLKLQQAYTESGKESYLIVRNVSANKAQEISTALSNQRGDRQRARYFSNTTINGSDNSNGFNSNSIAMNQSPVNSKDGGIAEVQQQELKFQKQSSKSDAMPGSKNVTEPTQSNAGNIGPAEAVIRPEKQGDMQLAGGRSSDADQITDVLIVVQAVSPTTPGAATQPSTQPAATQPAATQPSTQPSTQPAAIIVPSTQPILIPELKK